MYSRLQGCRFLHLGGEILLFFHIGESPSDFCWPKKNLTPQNSRDSHGAISAEVLALAAEATQLNQALAKWGWLVGVIEMVWRWLAEVTLHGGEK